MSEIDAKALFIARSREKEKKRKRKSTLTDEDTALYFDIRRRWKTFSTATTVTGNPIGLPIVRKTLLSTVLILSAVLLLLGSPVGSQSLTTITSWTTATAEVTSTSYTTLAAGTTSMTSVTTSFYSYSFTLPAELPRICYYHYVNGSLTAGQRLVGKVVVDYPLDFYVMSTAQFGQLPHSHCEDEHPALLKASYVKSYTIDWVAPSDGNYYLVFYSYNPSAPQPKITGSLSLQFADSQLIVSTLYSTSTGTVVSATTQTLSSVYYSTIQTFPGGSTFYLVVLAVVFLAALVVAFVVRASRRKATTPAATTPRMEALKQEKQFCVNCGAELALGSKFCNKCGSAQT